MDASHIVLILCDCGEYAMYLAGNLEFQPNLITIYIKHCSQMLSSDISVYSNQSTIPRFHLAHWILSIIKNFPHLAKIFITLLGAG